MMMKLMPIAGINNVSDDDSLKQGGDSPKLFVRDALNVDISETGRIALRKGAINVTHEAFKDIWQSPLHKDVFATLEGNLVIVSTTTWQHEVLANVGLGQVTYEVINNLVYIASNVGIWTYNGQKLHPLGIDAPAAPLVGNGVDVGLLRSGTYGIAISWLRGQQESNVSQISSLNIESISTANDEPFASIEITLPYCLDTSITEARIYITNRNGGELLHYADFPINTNVVTVSNIESLGMTARFKGLSPMPTGRFMAYWQGRLITADKNVLRFSEPMAYHLHDERFGFVMMPQKITFVLPVDGGIWVGQVTHVVFLTGNKPQDMTFQSKTTRAPVPDSAIEIDMNDIGGDISQSGNITALWLADNGYVVGTSSGQIIELQSGIMQDVVAKSGRSVRLGRRITTIVT